MESAYDAFQEGNRLLASENPHAAVIALERARDLEPDKGSVRETLARAYFRTGRFPRRGRSSSVPVEIEPVNDYAHFGLGLCLLRQGDRIGARRHLKLAVAMRPDQPDYRGTRSLRRVASERTASRERERGVSRPGIRRVARSGERRAGRRLRPRRGDLAGRRARSRPRPTAIAALRAAGLRVGVRVEQLELTGGRRGRQARTHRACRRPHADVVTSAIGGRVAARAVAGAGRARARVRRAGRARGARRRRPGRGRRRPGRRGGRRLPPRLRLRRASTARRPRCAPAPASSPPTSTPPIRCRAG